jgi:hypothetical protein
LNKRLLCAFELRSTRPANFHFDQPRYWRTT